METLEQWLVKELTKRNATITTAESCTGGLISGRIVNASGASGVFHQAFVTYSNEAKADVALSATGIAGPDGGTDEKPVGLVYLGCYCMGNTYVERHVFKGDRSEVRNAAVEAALTLAKKALKE